MERKKGAFLGFSDHLNKRLVRSPPSQLLYLHLLPASVTFRVGEENDV